MRKITKILPFLTLFAPLAVSSDMGSGMMGSGMMGSSSSSSGTLCGMFSGMNFGWFGWLWMFIIWIALIMGIMVLIKWLWQQGQKTTNSNLSKNALELLEERYAKGEISTKDFEERKKTLTK